MTQAPDGLLQLDDWCTLGAREKALSVVSLAADRVIRDVLEIGCGTGAVLGQLDNLGFGDRYWACEPMAALCDLAKAKTIRRMVGISCTTFDDETFAGQSYDLIILSHVLEHVLNPAELLSRALRRGRYAVVEVPIEANMTGKSQVRGSSAINSPPAHGECRWSHPVLLYVGREEARSMVRWRGPRYTALLSD